MNTMQAMSGGARFEWTAREEVHKQSGLDTNWSCGRWAGSTTACMRVPRDNDAGEWCTEESTLFLSIVNFGGILAFWRRP